ncbi:hypothetical protein DFQ01_109176 [Paenibacillus cellulosilyticus]|uniref:Uncharacterized protein n=1 Tax=Paenibacillus cellulosilyticus TaxID=375489 RepID=A0A2V2YTX4_9BACL|nr:hypothetical protein DFQ01_109176 [Paenibacillus cellulosilyticus]
MGLPSPGPRKGSWDAQRRDRVLGCWESRAFGQAFGWCVEGL